MPSLSDLKRSWLLKMMGLSSSSLSEADLATQLYGDSSFDAGVRRVSVPLPAVGQYFFPASQRVTGTLNTLGNNNLRVTPWIVEDEIRLDRLGAEVTAAGEAGSVMRLGIYKDNGAGKPGDLLIDAGTVVTTAVALPEVTISQLVPPGIYWIGGAVQAAPTTQPTMRTALGEPLVYISNGSAPAAASFWRAYGMSGVSGALPASFAADSITDASPRLHARAAAV